MPKGCLVFPAQAGVIRFFCPVIVVDRSIPRASGGDPSTIYDAHQNGSYSPRKRG